MSQYMFMRIVRWQDQSWYLLHNTWPVQVPMSMQMPGTPAADVGVAAPVLRLAPVLGREGRRRHAVEEARRASREVVAVPP